MYSSRSIKPSPFLSMSSIVSYRRRECRTVKMDVKDKVFSIVN